MKNSSTKKLIEGGIVIALAYVLSLVKIYQLPNGGSITAGSMVPILVYALRWGGGPGVFVGIVYGTIQFILGPKWSFHIVSILFDYSVAFGFLGLAGFFKGSLPKEMLGVFIGIFMRFAAHVVSGVVVWSSYAPEGVSPLTYSIIYNGSYLIPEIIISIFIYGLLHKPLKNMKY
ncbi:energy-coupled thiamine transporter ThiT [Anaeromicrobium sediminis]|uniref:Energy-coupled thiamine transporter ThiT n=1 Tax=Anaeromicrobium sediminis TaxID=1478221 RepID=A0A267MD80_9FIRM|nr:energy-coupled thiamine transporter ThiT [Anaeromicrobium sediminis]PAB57554.1 energy-coupled thiamine transporter ThiT [Anaeromicrobium sediminis]